MDSLSASSKSKAVCLTTNFERFAEKFKEENRGQGPYVDALGSDSPYVAAVVDMYDYSEVRNHGCAPGDPEYDPSVYTTERFYRYVEPVVRQVEESISPDSSDTSSTRTVAKTVFEWTSSGRDAFLRAQEVAEKAERRNCALRDQCVSRLLEQLSPESRTLLNNMKGAAAAIDANDLWHIFKVLLPESHDQVSNSAVAKRTQGFLSSSQADPLPTFVETFVRSSTQFLHDWESRTYKGYIKADALLCTVFLEAIRGGCEASLLQPCLEHFALHSRGHRDASLAAAQEFVASYYIRNRPSAAVEEHVAFKGSVPAPSSPSSCCSLCLKGSHVSLDELTSLIAPLPSPNNRVTRYLSTTGLPRFCRACIISPPPCACGQPRTAAYHKVCMSCFRVKNPKRPKDTGKALSASSDVPPSSTPPAVPSSASAVSSITTHPPSGVSSYPPPPYPQHMHPYWPHQHHHNAAFGYRPPHPAPSPAPYFPGQHPLHSSDDDALSDYSSSRGYSCRLSRDDWDRFAQSDDYRVLVSSFPTETIDSALLTDGAPAYRSTYHVDSGASMHCTDTLEHLTSPQPLNHVITIHGIGGAKVTFTHVGDLAWLPSGMRRCFYSPDFGARLISLAYLCLQKRTHFYNSPEHSALVINVDRKHFVTCHQSSNNLFPFPSEGRGPYYPPPPVVPDDQPFAGATSALSLRNFTPEQLARCDAVERLLEAYCRPSDETLAYSLSFGSLGPHGDGLTPSDVHLNRLLRGPDIYRAQSRVRDPPALPSTSSPAPRPCHTLVIDPHLLKHPDIFGNKYKILICCEFTGALYVIPSKTGTAASMMVALVHFIHSVCNSKGHRVEYIHADAASVLVSLLAPLGDMGITLRLAPPRHHAKRVERYTQTFDERKRMLLAQQPYLPPPALGLDIFADMHVAACMRALVNSVSHPNTPEELITRQRATLGGLLVCPFLSLVTVRMGDQKRAAVAATLMVPLQQAPHAELAMCMGRAPAHHPASYYMYIPSTNKIVIRRYFKRISLGVLPPFCVPNATFIAPIDPSANLRSTFPVDDAIQGHSIQNPERASQVPSPPPMAVPLDLAAGQDVPLAPGLSPAPVPPSAHVRVASPVSVSDTPLPSSVPSTLAPPCPVPSTPVAPLDDFVPPPSLMKSAPQPTPRVPPPAPPSLPIRSPGPVRRLEPLFASPGGPSPVSLMPCPPAGGPVVRASRRSNFGKPPARFDNSANLSHRQRRTALLAARAQSREAFCAATWADICSVDGPITPPDPGGGRAYTPPRVMHSGTPIAAAFKAGSRRGLGRAVRSRAPAVLPQLLRHICFMALMQQAAGALSTIDAHLYPTFQALGASPLITTAADPPLRFSPKENKEMTYRQGVASMPPEEVRAALVKELDKLFITHKALRPISPADIRPDAVRIYSSMLLKAKFFGDGTFDRISARLAAGGNTQPEHSYDETYAPTADEASTLCVFASFGAHAIQHHYASTLMYSNFDVKGAFLWVPRSNDTQIIMRLPSYIDHPLAGCEVEVLKSIYGLKDSNANFDADLRATIVSAGFRGTLDPCIYVKEAPNPIAPDIPFRCIVSTHVDDGRAMYNHRPFYDDLIRSLESRYGLLSKDDNTTSYTGSTFDSAPDGSFLLTQAGYIQRLLASTNLADLTVRSTPSDSDLFGDTSDTPPCHAKTYRQLVGSLIHLLRTRYDIQKEVVHLSSKMTCPTEGDMAKGIKVLQYLKGTPTLGPRYHTVDGPVLCVYVDASYATHHDGRSQTGCSFHIGRYSAPFHVKAGKQTECVSIGSMEAEYVALSQAGRKLLEFRYLLEDVGFPQLAPTVIYEDNMSAINLAVAPHITRKSRHIHTRHHFIRDLVAQKLAVVQHVPTADMLADFFTKPYGPKRFCDTRDRLFNSSRG